MSGKTVRPTPAALGFIRDIASEGSEGLDELVVPIGRVISYPELSANQPAHPSGGVMGGRAPQSSPLNLEPAADGGGSNGTIELDFEHPWFWTLRSA